MKVTTRAYLGNGRYHPPLWDVLVNGRPIGGGSWSRGRVLKMGQRYLPVSDDYSFPFVSFRTRREASRFVAAAYAQGTAYPTCVGEA